ncbi:MAG: hypothetical protein HY951_02210 [Bacteroidia bacterium]|nr:hypothetical protein [Bacteroidia bacterium]
MRRTNVSIIVIAIIYLLLHFIFVFWKRPMDVIASDTKEYYAFLPAFLINHDLTLKYIEQNPEFYADKIRSRNKLENGNYVIKTTMGLSFMYLPFFALAHVSTYFSEYASDGYTRPYGIALVFASLTYFFLGLFVLKKTLSLYFNNKVIGWVLFLIAFGTNITNYLTAEAAYSHSFSFALFSFFIWNTIKWHDNPNFKRSIYLGLLLGLISLIRPTNGLIVLVFILWNIDSLINIKERFYLFLKNYFKIFVILLLMILVWLPQLFYWKYVSGNWLFYSYDNEGFFFSNPHFVDVLVGFRKGWFIYTPLMFFASIGFVVLFNNYRKLFWNTFIFFIVNIYIISSWWCWWYGGSFGLRPFIDSYALMAIPLAAIVSFVLQRKNILKLFLLSFAVLLIVFNLFQNKKYFNMAIHYDSMTRESFFITLFKVNPTEEFVDKLETPDYDNARKGIPERKIKYITEDYFKQVFKD